MFSYNPKVNTMQQDRVVVQMVWCLIIESVALFTLKVYPNESLLGSGLANSFLCSGVAVCRPCGMPRRAQATPMPQRGAPVLGIAPGKMTNGEEAIRYGAGDLP